MAPSLNWVCAQFNAATLQPQARNIWKFGLRNATITAISLMAGPHCLFAISSNGTSSQRPFSWCCPRAQLKSDIRQIKTTIKQWKPNCPTWRRVGISQGEFFYFHLILPTRSYKLAALLNTGAQNSYLGTGFFCLPPFPLYNCSYTTRFRKWPFSRDPLTSRGACNTAFSTIILPERRNHIWNLCRQRR